jgi:adenylyltransferase/sulfurtransferase
METAQKVKLNLETTVRPRQWDETFQLMSWWDSAKVLQAKVMVVGAGALGNEVLKNLALLNVGHIFIVDFDTVEYANLCRSVLFREADCMGDQLKCEVAARRIKEINPRVKVQALSGDILQDVGLGVFRRMDVVIGCLDNRLARLFINRYCYKTNRVWVDGAIENLAGQLDVYKPGVSCYECQLTDVEHQMIKYRLGCPDIAMRNAAMGKIPTTPISSSIIGAMQVQEALKVVYGNDRQLIAGQQFKYEGMNFMTLQYPSGELKEDCESHFTIDELTEAPGLSAGNTIGELLQWIYDRFGDPNAIVHLGYEVVQEITTHQSGVTYPVLMPKMHLSDDVASQYRKIPGEDLVITRFTSRLDRKFSQQNATLRQIGVPPLQILTIEAKGAYYFVELTGDESYLSFR